MCYREKRKKAKALLRQCVLFIVTDTRVHLFFPVRPERGENGYNQQYEEDTRRKDKRTENPDADDAGRTCGRTLRKEIDDLHV